MLQNFWNSPSVKWQFDAHVFSLAIQSLMKIGSGTPGKPKMDTPH